MVKEHTSVVACPDCRGSLEEINVGSEVMGFVCQRCQLIYPIKDDILILLGSKSRNYNLEYDLIRNIEQKIQSDSRLTEWLPECINKTLNLLASHKETKSWEWEDEEFWARHYAEETTAGGEMTKEKVLVLMRLRASDKALGRKVSRSYSIRLAAGAGSGLPSSIDS